MVASWGMASDNGRLLLTDPTNYKLKDNKKIHYDT